MKSISFSSVYTSISAVRALRGEEKKHTIYDDVFDSIFKLFIYRKEQKSTKAFAVYAF